MGSFWAAAWTLLDTYFKLAIKLIIFDYDIDDFRFSGHAHLRRLADKVRDDGPARALPLSWGHLRISSFVISYQKNFLIGHSLVNLCRHFHFLGLFTGALSFRRIIFGLSLFKLMAEDLEIILGVNDLDWWRNDLLLGGCALLLLLFILFLHFSKVGGLFCRLIIFYRLSQKHIDCMWVVNFDGFRLLLSLLLQPLLLLHLLLLFQFFEFLFL